MNKFPTCKQKLRCHRRSYRRRSATLNHFANNSAFVVVVVVLVDTRERVNDVVELLTKDNSSFSGNIA
jgi:ERCC4-type nuclease